MSLFILGVLLLNPAFSQKLGPDVLLERANEVLYDNPKRAISLVEPILHSGNDEQVYEACYVLGDANYLLGGTEKALEYYEKCLLMAQAQLDESKIAQSYLGIGTSYDEMGEIDKAMDNYWMSLDIREEQNDLEGKSNVLNNIAVSFQKQGKYDKAIKYMRDVVVIDQELNDSLNLGYSYSNLGTFFYFNDQNDSALYYHQKALDVRTAMGQNFQISRTLNNIANVLVDLDKMDAASNYYERAISLKRSLNNPSELAVSLQNYGLTLSNHGKYYQALPYLIEANGILDSLKNQDGLVGNLRALSNTYGGLNRYDSAYTNLNRAYELRGELFDETKNAKIEEIMTKFETEQTNRENEELRAKRAEDSLMIERSKNRIYLLIGGMALVLFVAVLIFTRLRINRKNTATLKNLYDQLEQKNNNIVDSINYAKRIQAAILPSPELISENLPNSFIYYRPKDVVAGDFYWLEKQGDQLLFAVADCTGHGVPGAMVSVVCNNALNRSVREDQLVDTAQILSRSREIVISEFAKSQEKVKDGMDIALCSLNGLELSYTGAHNSICIVRKGEFDIEDSPNYRLSQDNGFTLLEIRGDRQPVGTWILAQDFSSHKIQLQKGDSIYLYSDGYLDQFGGEEGKKFKSANFKKLLLQIQYLSLSDQEKRLKEVFNVWKGDMEQIDDVCVMGVKI